MATNAEFLKVFQDNTGDLPQLTKRWFDLPTPHGRTEQLIKEVGILEVAKMIGGNDPRLSSRPGLRNLSPEARVFETAVKTDVAELVGKGQYLEAIQHANDRLIVAGESFEGDDLAGARINVFVSRAYAQGRLVEGGPLASRPMQDRIRAFGALSAGADYMRADEELGAISDRAMQVAECFGLAGLVLIQHRAVQLWAGGGVSVVNANMSDVRRSGTMQLDKEVAGMQRKIMQQLRG